MLGSTFLTVGGALQASASTLAHMIIGRIVGSIGTGLNTTAIPMWQAETCKQDHRGRLVVMELILNIYLMFGVFNVAFLPVVWYFYVETAGLALEQIDRVVEIQFENGRDMSTTMARKQVLLEVEVAGTDEKGVVSNTLLKEDTEHLEDVDNI